MNFNNIINKHILYDGDHSLSTKKNTPLLESPFLHLTNQTIPIHFCHVFVVTVP
jgi:hypothetical protein